VLKLTGSEDRGFGNHESVCWDAERHDDHYLESGSYQGFANMKPDARGYVHVQIGVMRPVESPKNRQSVIQPVKCVKRYVEKNDGRRDCEYWTQVKMMEQSPVLLFPMLNA
jgi:hypothetical protein